MKATGRSVAGYNRLAKPYQALEWMLFGRQLQFAREALLDQLPPCDRTCVLGDGNGRLLEKLCRKMPESKVVSVDQSENMLALQQDRLARAGLSRGVEYVCADAVEVQLENESIDLLVAAFFLDCFTAQQLVDQLPQWMRMLRPGGLFYVVDFQVPKAGWQRRRARFYLALMHWFFRWQTGLPNRQLVDLESILQPSPLSLVAASEHNRGLMFCRIYQKQVSA